MYLLYTDETATDPKDCAFLIYGGLAVPGDKALALHEAIETARGKAGIGNELLLKFNPTPSDMQHNDFKALKQEVLIAACDHDCSLFTSLIHHGIVSGGMDHGRRNCINTVMYHFDCFLHQVSDHGIAIIDRIASDKEIDKHMRRKFSVGVEGLPYTPEYRLKKIVGFHYGTIGQSHFASLVDIAVGSLRWAIKAHLANDEKNLKSAKDILELLEPLLYHDNNGKVSELGMMLSPKTVRSPKYLSIYQDLKGFFHSAGVYLSQNITSEPNY